MFVDSMIFFDRKTTLIMLACSSSRNRTLAR